MSYEKYKNHRLAPDDNGCVSVLTDPEYEQVGTYPSKAAAKRAIDEMNPSSQPENQLDNDKDLRQEIGLKHKTDKATYHRFYLTKTIVTSTKRIDGRLLEIGVYKDADGSQNPDTIAMSIVYNLGDALYNELKGKVPAKYVVKARQATNDKFIDYATDLINQQIKSVFDELESELDDGKNSHSMKVISSAIQKIRSRYE